MMGRLWHRALSRRSQKAASPGLGRIVIRSLPPVRIYHPYPLRYLGVVI
jgi:hypothetical protein